LPACGRTVFGVSLGALAVERRTQGERERGREEERWTHELEDAQDRVDVPPAVGRKAFGGGAHLGRHAELELVVGHLEEGEELARQDAHVRLVDERVRELERAAADRDVAIAQAVEDDGAVALDGVRVHGDDLEKSVERDVANVVVAVAEELAEDVDGHDAQAAVGFDVEDREDRLVQDRVADVLGRLGVGRDLGEDVVHGLARLDVALAEQPQEAQDLDLEERVRDAAHVVLGRVVGRDERLEVAHEERDRLRAREGERQSQEDEREGASGRDAPCGTGRCRRGEPSR